MRKNVTFDTKSKAIAEFLIGLAKKKGLTPYPHGNVRVNGFNVFFLCEAETLMDCEKNTYGFASENSKINGNFEKIKTLDEIVAIGELLEAAKEYISTGDCSGGNPCPGCDYCNLKGAIENVQTSLASGIKGKRDLILTLTLDSF